METLAVQKHYSNKEIAVEKWKNKVKSGLAGYSSEKQYAVLNTLLPMSHPLFSALFVDHLRQTEQQQTPCRAKSALQFCRKGCDLL